MLFLNEQMKDMSGVEYSHTPDMEELKSELDHTEQLRNMNAFMPKNRREKRAMLKMLKKRMKKARR